jgi:predicted nucleic acid-binding protein
MTRPADSLVLDASVATKWYLSDEEDSAAAANVLGLFYRDEIALLAPTLIVLEVASAITIATAGQRPRLGKSEGREAIGKFLQLGLATFPDDRLVLPAYDLVGQVGCAIYDALYLALARSLSIPLLTADARFYRLVGRAPDVLWIGNYSPAA